MNNQEIKDFSNMRKDALEILDIMSIPRSAQSKNCHDALLYREKLQREKEWKEKKAKWGRCEDRAFAYVYSIWLDVSLPEMNEWIEGFIDNGVKIIRTCQFTATVHVHRDSIHHFRASIPDIPTWSDAGVTHGRHGVYFVDEEGKSVYEKGMT